MPYCKRFALALAGTFVIAPLVIVVTVGIAVGIAYTAAAYPIQVMVVSLIGIAALIARFE